MNRQQTPSPNSTTDNRLILLAPDDNVFVLRAAIHEGEVIQVGGIQVSFELRIGIGHKIARMEVPVGAKVLKYGAPIGSATMDISVGDHVHTHNLKSDYTPTYTIEGTD